MKTYIVVIFLVFFSVCNSQKIVKKSILSPEISTIQVDGSNCYRVEINAKDIKKVIVEAQIDGEYSKDLIVNVKEDNSFININAGFQPVFKNPNDKLSAHKVVSISLIINVPLKSKTNVLGTNSNVFVSGEYNNLFVSIKDGQCVLNNVLGTIKVQTQSGDILVKKCSGIFVAESKYGEVKQDVISKGKSHFYLTTTTGNILLEKMK